MIGGLRSIASILGLCLPLISGCGGGSAGSDNGSAPVQSTASLQYPTPVTFNVGQAISPLSPTVTGAVASFSVAPGLPAGLSLNTSTGIISGTPNSVSPSMSYTVVAGTAGGDVQATITITVNGASTPVIAYSAAAYVFPVNTPLAEQPKSTGGIVTNWSVSPTLPPGLAIDQKTGSIAGTPTANSATTSYTVTAANSGGQATATVTITVATPTVILDTGLAGSVTAIRSNGSQVVSLESDGVWLLQAAATGRIILRGRTFCGSAGNCSNTSDAGHAPADLVAGFLIDALSTDGSAVSEVEIRSSASGAVIATASGTFSWYYLSSDGSYVCAATPSSLSAWSTASGALVATFKGDYSAAAVFCAAGQMQVANGPAGGNVIQTLGVSTGVSSTTAPFQGTFQFWFADGNHFITATGTAVWIYSEAATQVQPPIQLQAGPIAGWGNYFWNDTDLYQIGNDATPVSALSNSTLFSSGNTLAALSSGVNEEITIFDLSGATVSQQSYAVPIGSLESYASTGAQWFVGNEFGVVFDGATSSDLTLGAITGVAGGTQYFSVATASGQVFSYNANTNTQTSVITFAASQLVASTSGTAMIAANTQSNEVLVFAPASGMPLRAISVGSADPLNSVSLASSGMVFGATFTSESGSACRAFVDEVTGKGTGQVGGGGVLCNRSDIVDALQLSPDGTVAAVGTGTFVTAANLVTYLYTNGALTTALSAALPIAWLDNNDLLVGMYTDVTMNGQTYPVGNGAAIVNAAGTLVGAAGVSCGTVPCLSNIQVLSPTEIYIPDYNSLLSVQSGSVLWQGPGSGPSAITGSELVLTQNETLLLAVPASGGG